MHDFFSILCWTVHKLVNGTKIAVKRHSLGALHRFILWIFCIYVEDITDVNVYLFVVIRIQKIRYVYKKFFSFDCTFTEAGCLNLIDDMYVSDCVACTKLRSFSVFDEINVYIHNSEHELIYCTFAIHQVCSNRENNKTELSYLKYNLPLQKIFTAD